MYPATTTSWHDRLGHINYKCIRHMNKDGLISDSKVENVNKTEDFFCEACQYGKQHHFPLKSFSREKPKAGELIHSDVCGKMSQESVGGANYFVSFKDDCTVYHMIYFIKRKFDVFREDIYRISQSLGIFRDI